LIIVSIVATGIVDTGGKFATGNNNTSETGGKMEKLFNQKNFQYFFWTTVSFTPVATCQYQQH
jgi:hypothetical protein